jgi:hypothetical protein
MRLKMSTGNADTYSSAVTIDPSRILRPCGCVRGGEWCEIELCHFEALPERREWFGATRRRTRRQSRLTHPAF